MIILPIEIKKRELMSKLLIASKLINRGGHVLIGHDIVINNAKNISNCSFLLKSGASFEKKFIQNISKSNMVFVLDEEGIIPPINDPSVSSRYNNDSIQYFENILLNGPLEEQLLKDINCYNKKFITGDPRTDLCKKEYRDLYIDEIEKIRNLTRNKDILLVVSRFGDVNLHKELDYIKLLKDAGFIHDSKSEKFFTEHYEHTNKIFKDFLKLPKLLAIYYPDKMVVVRPHPSENYKTWSEIADQDNILVCSDWDITSWLHAGCTLIHNGCTTAVEASANGTKIISYKPIINNEYDNQLADELGICCYNVSEIRAAINHENWVMDRNKLNKIVKFQECVDSSDLISEIIINKKNSKLEIFHNFKLKLPFKIRLIKIKLRILSFLKTDNYINQKFVKLSATEISETFEKLNIKEFEIVSVGPDCYLIKSNVTK